ncbi:glutathione S-transferase-like protein [Leptospira meyeri]|uniref:Glutathione S-transferase-like protein n=1 Tax=Leptospira meyeri TaxID=29508 RepID=A0A4R8MW36_LEPME|nr:glutathione S-transferase N-terminal domain-containing protein [Leptospira meyeri]EKJ88725.1 glutaredoxin [Leptospira meyeri serovar Hardjo str. Went 5]TDY71295.1 glutathione S-transferase-like protein [Leptospira meyeri]TGL48296.1 glutaredoxin [Leptospira meyeri]
MIRLYQYDTCPYCRRVIQTTESLGLIPGKDIEYVEASYGTPGRAEVVRLGGLSQVPFLVDGDVQMYESADIIAYLRSKYS